MLSGRNSSPCIGQVCTVLRNFRLRMTCSTKFNPIAESGHEPVQACKEVVELVFSISALVHSSDSEESKQNRVNSVDSGYQELAESLAAGFRTLKLLW